MPQKKYFFNLLTLLIFSNCQLAEVHVDCPSGDCLANDLTQVVPKAPTFSGYYRLKTKFRGATESLDDGRGVTRTPNGGVFMNLNEDSPHQLWRFDTLDNGYFRIKSKAGGDNKSLEANGTASPVHDGTSFMDNQQNVIGQYWYLELVDEEYYHLKIATDEDRCLEGNNRNGLNKDGAAFMMECSSAIGQLWKLEKVME